jgi:hypothetical protein
MRAKQDRRTAHLVSFLSSQFQRTPYNIVHGSDVAVAAMAAAA